MTDLRIFDHPIVAPIDRRKVSFRWSGARFEGLAGEMIASALVANGVHIFGYHPKDNSPQGVFCANGQCAQCLVMVDGRPLKACMTPLAEGMQIEPVRGLPQLPADDRPVNMASVETVETDVLIIGGGPAGLAAAVELGRLGVDVLLVDDKDRLGGKLVLQTHKFFGSVEDSYAGTRGFEIGTILAEELSALPSVRVWLQSTAVGVFSDRVLGIARGDRYVLVVPKKLMIATGAREKMLSFPGNTLPGVYGAGAFQTLVNRDLVRSAQRILVVGGGNVGLIAAYHAIQAGIEVAVLIEALPQVGGYKVHADKLARLGVPILTGHTIVAAHGEKHVTGATIARLDADWQVVAGTAQHYEVDTILVAVGLDKVDEFYHKAKAWGMDVFSAGDAQEIAEASAAMFTGKIEGLKIAQSLGLDVGPVPKEWHAKADILKAKPGDVVERDPVPDTDSALYPVFHCFQEVPCNPCTSVCPAGAIRTENDAITGLPYLVETETCTGCLRCVAVCPGLALTVVDGRKDPERPIVWLPYEIWRERVAKGQQVPVTDRDGALLGRFPVVDLKARKKFPGTLLVGVAIPHPQATAAAGIWVQEAPINPSQIYEKAPLPDTAIVCRCERVSAGEIRESIRSGVRDINQLKALTRCGMGSCGAKTCRPMIWRIFKEEGVDLKTVTDRVDRPLFVEVPIGQLAGAEAGE